MTTETTQSFSAYTAPQVEATVEIIQKRSKWLTVIAIGFFVSFLGNILASISFFLLTFTLEKVITAEIPYVVPFQVYRNFPILSILPIVFSVIAVLHLLNVFISWNASRRGWSFSVIGTILSPVITLLVIYFAFEQFNDLFAEGLTQERTLSLILNNSWLLLLIVGSIFFRKKYFRDVWGIGLFQKIILGLCIIYSIAITSFVLYGVYRSSDQDLGYSAVRQKVDYPIYRLTNPRNYGSEQSTLFFLDEERLASQSGVVKVMYGSPISTSAEDTEIIGVRQVKVPASFDYAGFISEKSASEGAELSEFALDNSLTGKAAIISSRNSRVTSVYYLTDDNVLVQVLSPRIEQAELLTIINGLE